MRTANSHYTKTGRPKIAYGNVAEATVKALNLVDDIGEHHGAPYQCAECNDWHIGGGETAFQELTRRAAEIRQRRRTNGFIS